MKCEHVGADVQPLTVEQNLLGCGSNDEGSDIVILVVKIITIIMRIIMRITLK